MKLVLARHLAALAIIAIALAATVAAGASRYQPLLDNSSERNKLAALAAMEDAARIDPSIFAKLMADGNALIRLRCAEVLGRTGDERAVAHLERLAEDADPRVVETAVHALGLLRSAAAVPALERRLAASEETIKIRALEALGRTGTKEAAPVIAPFLRHFKSVIRAEAALALAFTGDSAAASECDVIVQDEDQHVAACAAYAMGRLGYRAGAARIETLLGSRDPEARLRAVEALGRLKAGDAVPLIAPLIRDSDRWIAIKAAEALQRIGKGSGADALASLLISDDSYLKTAGLRGLASTAGGRHLSAIEPLLFDPSPMVRRAALGAVVKASGGRSRQYLLDAIERGSPGEQSTALELIGTLGNTEDLQLLCRVLTRAESPLLAEGAAVGLGAWKEPKDLMKPCGMRDAAGNEMTPLDALLAAGGGDDPAVGGLAIESLGKTATEDMIPHLTTLYDTRSSRADGDRRLAIVEAVQALSRTLDAAKRETLGIPAFLARAHRDADARVSAAADAVALGYGTRIPESDSMPPDRGSYPWGEPSLPIGNRRIVLSTARGDIEIILYGDDAPNAVRSILTLAEGGFYDGLTFHRVVPGFVIQGGCPRGDGWGDAGYYLRNEVNLFHFRRGTVGLADSGMDTAGSQFFIMHTEHPHLDGRYTIVGRVTRGMDVVDRIEEGDTFTAAVIE